MLPKNTDKIENDDPYSDDIIIKPDNVEDVTKSSDEEEIIVTRKYTITEMAVIDNLKQIFNELVSILKITDPKIISALEDEILTLFPDAVDLDEVIKGVRGKEYTRDLLKFLRDNKELLENIKLYSFAQVSLSYALESPFGLVNYLNSINDLFVVHQSDIKINDDYLLDLLAVSNMLRNKDAFEKQMDKLEEKIVEYAKFINAKLLPIILKSGKKSLTLPPADDPNKPYDKQKILSRFLYKWAKDNDFNQEEFAKITRFLDSDEFLSLLVQMIVFKDAGSGAKHGPWSHLTQLFFLIEENKDNPFLKHLPTDLYAYLGDKNLKGKKSFLDWKTERASTPFTAWDVFLDRANSNNKKDFGTPEIITKRLCADAISLLTKNKARWPLVSSIFFRQKLKQDNLPKNDKQISTEAIVRRKYKES